MLWTLSVLILWVTGKITSVCLACSVIQDYCVWDLSIL